MKIGLVRRGYSASGGAENYLRRLGTALEEAGHTSALFAGPEWPPAQWPAHRELIQVPGGSPRRFADGLAALLPCDRCDLLFSLERVWTCDCYRAGDGLHRAWLERRARVEPGWRDTLRRWNPKHRQILRLENALFGPGGAGRVIANSRLVRDEIVSAYPDFPAGRIEVVHNGLPPGAFRAATPSERTAARFALGLGEREYVLLFVGTGWERKGLAHALRGLARLPASLDARLLVAGRGRPGPFLRGVPPATAGRTRFLGPVNDLTSCYAAADVFVLPTLYDPFSNACLEALASGLPVITSDANGFGDVLTPGVDGEIVPTIDWTTGERLAAALAAWADPARLRAARIACVEKAAPLTMERNVAQTLAALGIV